jgi:type II restriction/modification system DNA methylase subunit YeeA
VYEGRVARESDLCCYWYEKARAAIEVGQAKRAGLLATQAIRGGANRKVLERIKETGDIFYAQSDRPWIQDGVAVRVSMVGFDDGSEHHRLLNEETEGEAKNALRRARPVVSISANLTFEADVTKARRLKENVGICFQGPVVVGPFDLAPGEARKMLAQHNPHGRPNSDVIFPVVNASDIARRPSDRSIIDYGQMTERDAALYEAPFEHVRKYVKPLRDANRDKQRRQYWWRHGRAGTELREASAGLTRVIATPRVAKHRFFVWLPAHTVPDSRVFVFARADDFFFGVLSSRAHEEWSLATSSRHGVGNDPTYNNTTCFETYPFPRATKVQQRAVWLAAKELDDLRVGWLHPQGMIGAKELAKRTLTELYNKRPTWLADAHRKLDQAMFAAYGWPESPDDLTDAEIVARLLALNLAREPA